MKATDKYITGYIGIPCVCCGHRQCYGSELKGENGDLDPLLEGWWCEGCLRQAFAGLGPEPPPQSIIEMRLLSLWIDSP